MLQNIFTAENISDFIYFAIPLILSIYTIINVKKSKFFYYENTSIKLHDEITKDIEELEIKYKGDEVKGNLKLVKGSFLLSSMNDVKKDEIDKELCIYSKDKNALWKFFKIIDSSESFDPSFRIEDNKVFINKSLFKINDFITFTGIIDSKDNNFYVSQRIYNIETTVEKFTESDKKNLQTSIVSGSFILIILILSYFIPYLLSNKEKEIRKPFLSDYKVNYFENDKEISFDSIKKQITNQNERIIKTFEDKRDLQRDSLTAVYRDNPSCENELNILRWLINMQKEHMDLKLSGLDDNGYDISIFSDKLLLKLYNQNKIDTLEKHTYNDSIKFQYRLSNNNKNLTTEKEKFDFISILYYISCVYTLYYVVKKIIRLRKLLKLINILKRPIQVAD